ISRRSCPMTNKELQRVTECIADIGHVVSQGSLPSRRQHISPNVRIASQRTLYLSVHDDGYIGHDRLKHCSSLPDLIGRHLLVEYCHRDELAHMAALVIKGGTRDATPSPMHDTHF